MIEVKVKQLFLSNVGFVVVLGNDEDKRSLPIFIGAPEAQSIAIWVNRVDVPRPLTHDLLRNILDFMECRLLRIEICDLKEGTFFARMVLRRDGAEMALDSRPSDAIALALRCSAPIYVAARVMDEAGRIVEEDSTPPSDSPAEETDTPPHKPLGKLTPLEALKQSLANAVADERYEDAAKLRDEIGRMSHTHNKN